MCGIFGFISNKPSTDNLELTKRLLVASDSRGKDASGILVVRADGTYEMQKAPIEAQKFVSVLDKMKHIINEAVVIVGHTRSATVGKPENNENNHPIESDDWIMVHNGSCTNMNKVEDYKYKGEVDSELLLSHLQVGGVEGLRQLGKGSASVAFINKSKPVELYLWRDSNPCHVGINEFYKTEIVLFASTEYILKQVAPKHLKLFSSLKIAETNNKMLYKITRRPIDVEELGVLDTLNPPKPKYKIDSVQIDKIVKGFPTRFYQEGYGGANMGYGYGGNYSRQNNTDREDITGMVWNEKEKRWYINPHRNRYYLKSHDFEHWTKLMKPMKGYVSTGADLIKFYDQERNMHFIITAEDAHKEELIPTRLFG